MSFVYMTSRLHFKKGSEYNEVKLDTLKTVHTLHNYYLFETEVIS